MDNTARAHVTFDPMWDGVDIVVSPRSGSVLVWVVPDVLTVGEGAAPPDEAHLRMPKDSARALYEALAEYFGGGPADAQRLRGDYDSERRRVDKFIDALISGSL